MSVFISSLNVPIGYTTPKFPSLFWPLGPTKPAYSQSILYYERDVWAFTVGWFMIMFVAFYLVSGSIACINYGLYSRKSNKIINMVMMLVTFVATGAATAFVSGSFVGLLLSVVYRAGSMTMSTWIPFTWAMVGILYDISTSYSTSQITL